MENTMNEMKLEAENYRRTFWAMSDVEEYHDYHVRGFMEDGKFKGFVWIEWDIDFSSAYIPLTRHFIGLVNEEKVYNDDLEQKVPELLCGVKFSVHGSKLDYSVRVIGDIPENLCIEKDDQDRVTFCGMQKDGMRDGLGSEFSYPEEGKIVELQGFWQKGKLTHKCEMTQLIAI